MASRKQPPQQSTSMLPLWLVDEFEAARLLATDPASVGVHYADPATTPAMSDAEVRCWMREQRALWCALEGCYADCVDALDPGDPFAVCMNPEWRKRR